MADHQIDAEVVASVVEHQQALRSLVTGDKSSECKDTLVVAAPATAPDMPLATAVVPPEPSLKVAAPGLIKLGTRKTGE